MQNASHNYGKSFTSALAAVWILAGTTAAPLRFALAGANLKAAVLISFRSATHSNLANVSGQPAIKGALASVTCGVTGTATAGLVVSATGGSTVLNLSEGFY